MSKKTFICPVRESELLNNDLLERCTAGLADGPRSGQPFMLSYDIYAYDQYVFANPLSRLWCEDGGEIRSFRLSQHADLARSHAPQMFAFLEAEALRDVFWNALTSMFPEGSGETFHACISVHGVILLAEQALLMASRCQKDPFLGFNPPALSNHQLVAHMAGLEACAAALLGAQHPGATGDQTPQVRVERA